MEKRITASQGWCTDRLDDGGIEPAPWSKTVAARRGEHCHRPLRIASVVASCLAALLAAGPVAPASTPTDPAARKHDTYLADLARGLLLSEDVLVVTVVRHEGLERPGMRPRYWTRFEAVVDSVLSGDRSPGESVQFLRAGGMVGGRGARVMPEIFQFRDGGRYVIGLSSCLAETVSVPTNESTIAVAEPDSVRPIWESHSWSWPEFRRLLTASRAGTDLRMLASQADACVLARVNSVETGNPMVARAQSALACRLAIEEPYRDVRRALPSGMKELEIRLQDEERDDQNVEVPSLPLKTGDQVVVFLQKTGTGWSVLKSPFAICTVSGNTVRAAGNWPFCRTASVFRTFTLEEVRHACEN